MKKSFALFALLAACAPAEDKPSIDDGDRPETNCTPVEPGIPTDAALDVADASNAFAVDMYDTVASTATAQQNLFFSPFSISSALSTTFRADGRSSSCACSLPDVDKKDHTTRQTMQKYDLVSARV